MAKTTKLKRPLSNSTQAALVAARNASLPLLMPPEHVHLLEIEMPFWNAIISARARQHWTEVDLMLAANLANALCEIETLRAEIRETGNFIDGGLVVKETKTPTGNLLKQTRQGAPIVNPRHQLLETLTKRALALSRIIHVHALATDGNLVDERNKNSAAAKAATEKKSSSAGPEMLFPDLGSIKLQ